MHADLVYGHTGYDVTSYFRSVFTEVRKTAEKADSDGFESNFSGTAFCLPHKLVGILFFSNIIFYAFRFLVSLQDLQ